MKPATDRDLETVALKCLRKEPSARYGSAEELAQDLERWLEGIPILARPLGGWARALRWSRRHPLAAALGVALLLSLAAILAGASVAVMRIQRAEEKSTASLRESLLREAGSLRLGGGLGHRTEGLRLLREAAALGGPAPFRLRARNELLATLARTDLEFVPSAVTSMPAQPERHAVLFTHRAIASVTNETTIAFHALRDGAPMGRLTWREDPVVSLDASSPDGRYLAVWHQANFRIWELATGAHLPLAPATNLVFAFHPREQLVVIQTNANEAIGLELPSGRELFRWKAPLPRLAGRDSGWHTLAFSPNGRQLAGASATSRLIELMTSDTGDQIRVLTNSAHTVAMSWSQDGRLLAAATADNHIMLWETASGALRWESPPMVNRARRLAFHPRGEWLAAACEDDYVRLLDLATGRITFEHPGQSPQLAFSPRGHWLGPIHWQGQAGLLEIRRPAEFSSFEAGPEHLRLSGGQFGAHGRILSVGHSDQVVLCDPVRGTRYRTRNDWRMSACLFLPTQDQLLVAEGNGMVRYALSFGSRGELEFSSPEIVHPGSGWTALNLSPDGRCFAAYNRRTQMATIFDHTLTNRLSSVGPHADVGDVTVSPDGRWVTTGSHANRNLKLWDATRGDLVRTSNIGVHPRGAFSNDGRWLAVTSEDEFELWEAGTWKNVLSFPPRSGRRVFGAAAFSPDGHTLAIVVDRFTVQLFDLRQQVSIGTLRPPVASQLQGLAYAPDGSRLAAFGNNATVAVWHLHEIDRALADFGLSWDLSPAQSGGLWDR
jgi:WD40 repeat protein